MLLSVPIYLSLAAGAALAAKHPMAWLALVCTLLLLASANVLIIGLSLSLQHSALRATVVQPHGAPDRLLRQATPVAGLKHAAVLRWVLPPVQPGATQQASTNVAKLCAEAVEAQLTKRRRRDAMHKTSPTPTVFAQREAHEGCPQVCTGPHVD